WQPNLGDQLTAGEFGQYPRVDLVCLAGERGKTPARAQAKARREGDHFSSLLPRSGWSGPRLESLGLSPSTASAAGSAEILAAHAEAPEELAANGGHRGANVVICSEQPVGTFRPLRQRPFGR